MPKQLDRILLFGALAAWVIATILVLATGQPLSHDEAAFAIGAKRILAGAPAVMLHRSVGTELLAVPGTLLGGGEIALRLVFAVVSLVVPIGACALARAAFPTRHAGGLAAAVFACGHPMILQAGQLMSDLCATGFILLALAVLVRELSRDGGPRWSILVAAPLLAGAFYVRYGIIPAIAGTAVAIVICYARPLLRAPGKAVALAALVIALMAPHLIYSIHETDSALGVLHTSAGSTAYPPLGAGFWPLVSSNPFLYYGFFVAPAMLVGLVTAWRTREGRCVLVAGLVTLLLLGTRSYPLPRYTFPWVALLAVSGTGWLADALKDRRAAVVIGAFVIGWGATAFYAVLTTRHQRSTRMPSATLALDIARDAAGRTCTITAARTPVLSFYSGCMPADWPDAPQNVRNYLVPPTPEDGTIGPPDIPDHAVTRMASHPGVFVID